MLPTYRGIGYARRPVSPDSQETVKAIEAVEGKARELRRLLRHYEAVLTDLRRSLTGHTEVSSSLPEETDDEPAVESPPAIPADLSRLLECKTLSVARSAFAVVYFLGPSTLDQIFQILVHHGRIKGTPRSKIKDQLRAAVQGTSPERITVDPRSKLYSFVSSDARAWFETVLSEAMKSQEHVSEEMSLFGEGGT